MVQNSRLVILANPGHRKLLSETTLENGVRLKSIFQQPFIVKQDPIINLDHQMIVMGLVKDNSTANHIEQGIIGRTSEGHGKSRHGDTVWTDQPNWRAQPNYWEVWANGCFKPPTSIDTHRIFIHRVIENFKPSIGCTFQWQAAGWQSSRCSPWQRWAPCLRPTISENQLGKLHHGNMGNTWKYQLDPT